MTSINLETGDSDYAEEETPYQRRRREKRESSATSSSRSSSKSSGSKTASEKNNASLTGRLDNAFSKIASQLEAKGDTELSEAIEEEKRPMAQGLVSLSDSLTPLRPVLVLILALAEPFLAFWRVGRILFRRFLEWRERRYVEQQNADGTGTVTWETDNTGQAVG